MPDVLLRYNVTSYLDSLPAYTLGAGQDGIGTDSFLDLARKITESGNYYFMGYPFPQSNVPVPAGALSPTSNIAALGSIQGNISLQPDTYIVSLGVFSLHREVVGGSNNGFKISIYDKGARAYIVDKGYVYYETLGSNGDTDLAAGTLDTPFGTHFFQSPFIVVHPGILQVEITNLNVVDDYIQIMLGCAVPITKDSTNTHVMKGGS